MDTVELSPREARFLLDCISFSRDAGVLKATAYPESIQYELAGKLAPIANREG